VRDSRTQRRPSEVIPSNLTAQLQGLADTSARFAEQGQKMFERLRPAIEQSMQLQRRLAVKFKLDQSFLRGATAGRPKFNEPLKTLAENGWFISWWNTPVALIYPLARLFESGQTERANRRLRNHFAEQIASTECRLRKQFPRRATILQKAFTAHRCRDYELSIPVFLIQADGVAREIIGGDVYSRQAEKRQKLKTFVASITFDEFQKEIIELLLLPMPLNASTGDSTLIKGVLARHEILHGTQTKYASATNSYRAISWLQYVAAFEEQKDFAKRHQERKKADRL
jgi:hypothetical protein